MSMGVGAGDLQRCLPSPSPLCVRWFCRDLNQSAAIQPGPSSGAAVKEAARRLPFWICKVFLHQLGKKGKDFDFSQLPMRVEFVECSARGSKGEEGDADFEGLEKWLAKIA